MKKLLIGTATAVLLCGAAYAEDNGLRSLDLLGEPPGAGAMGPNRGDVVFPDGPINTPFNRGGGAYGMYGYAPSPAPFGLFGPPVMGMGGPGYYGYDTGPGYYGYSMGPGYYGYSSGPRHYGHSYSSTRRSTMHHAAPRDAAPRARQGTDLPGERPGVQTSPTAGD
jgi:hypothetical protein